MKKILNIFDNKKFKLLGLKHNKGYIKNKPFPHVYIDNFLPKKLEFLSYTDMILR